MSPPAAKPFRLSIPEQAIADLHDRLARTRWPDEPPLERWSTGRVPCEPCAACDIDCMSPHPA